MKGQWNLIFAFVFALIVAIFAVVNVEPVVVDYVFGTANWPLILVVLGSVLMGGVIVASVGLFRLFSLQRNVKTLQKENATLKDQLQRVAEKPKESSKTPEQLPQKEESSGEEIPKN